MLRGRTWAGRDLAGPRGGPRPPDGRRRPHPRATHGVDGSVTALGLWARRGSGSEQTDMKKEVLAAIEAVAPDAWVATNTSSLSVDALASVPTRPQRFIGLHFLNPVPASQLVEIVVGAKTAPDLVDLSRSWVADRQDRHRGDRLARIRVLASRVEIALEAMRMLEEGVTTAEDIDTPWSWATSTRSARCAPPTSLASTYVSRSPITSHVSWETGSPHRRSCGRRLRPGTSAGSRARGSTPGDVVAARDRV